VPVFNNLAGAMFDVQADYGLAGTEAATFNNAGTFKKSAGTATTSITSAWTFNNTGLFEVQSGTVSAAGPFNNSGTVDVWAGRTLTLSGGGTSSGGFVLGSGAALQFTGGEHAFNTGATVTGGAMTASAGTLRFDGTTLLSLPVAFSGGTWTGGGAVTAEALSWTGGTMTGTGTTEVPADRSLSISGSSTKSLGRTITSGGMVTFMPSTNLSSAAGGSGAVINNLAGGMFDVQVNYGLDGTAPAVFNNAGTFKKSAGTSTTTIGSAWTFNNTGIFQVQTGALSVAGPFNNTGTVEAAAGTTLRLSGGGTSNGAFTVATNASLDFAGDHLLRAGVTVTGAGSATFSGGTTTLNGLCSVAGGITISGGIVNFDTPWGLSGTAIRLSSGTIAGNQPLVNDTSFTGYGTIGGNAGFTNRALLSVTSGSLTLSNTGSNSNMGTVTLGTGMQLRLTGGPLGNAGTFNLNSGVVAGTAAFANITGGTLNGGGTILSPFSNTGGTVRVASDTLNIAEAFSNTGLIRIEAGMGLAGGAMSNLGTIQGDGSIANAVINHGQIECSDGILLFGGPVTNTSSGSVTAGAGGKVLFNAAVAANQGALHLSGGTFQFAQAFINGSSGRISGRGTLLFGGGMTNEGLMQFSGGLTDIRGPVSLTGGITGGKVINSGTGNLVTLYDRIMHNGAEIRTSATNTTVFFGDVSGTGGFTGGGTVRFEGTYSPGGSAAEVLFEGDAEFAKGSWLLMEIGGRTPGTEYDVIRVLGNLSLACSLEMTLIDGFGPRFGDRFDLFDWGTLSGTFETVRLPTLNGPLTWDTSSLYATGEIAVMPEPSTLFLLALGGLGVLSRRRGK